VAPSAFPAPAPRSSHGTIGAIVAVAIAAIGLAVLGGSWLTAEDAKPTASVEPQPAPTPAPSAATSTARAPEPPQPSVVPPEPSAPPAPSGSANARPSADGRTLLTIQCQPACIVLIDGQRIGISPVKERRVAPGPHRITAYRQGVGAKVLDVEIKPGQQATYDFAMTP
jgi:hypothetical protein